MMGFGWIVILVLVVLLVSGVLFPTGSNRPSTVSPRKESSLDIAARRYARGEISKDEFESIKRALA